MVSLRIYNETYWSLCSFNDDILKVGRKGKKYKNYSITSSEEEIERISLSRTKRNIKEICLCNDFEYFFTCTVNSEYADRFHLQEVQDKMKKICKKIRRKNESFKYIFITEKHKDGAFHFHGMCKSIELYRNEWGYLSSKDFDTLGYNSFSIIKDYNACCSYITKYITKSCVKNENNQIYFCSRGLKKAQVEYMIDQDLSKIFDNLFENEYCQKKDFCIDQLSREQKMKLNDYFTKNDEILQQDNNYITNWLNLFTNYYKNGNIIIHK